MRKPAASGLHCPRCRSDAYYRYGKTASNKPRFLCKVCNRQFSIRNGAFKESSRPGCPACGKPMHVYMRNGNSIRFRCADYPRCRTFLKRVQEGSLSNE